MNRSRLLGGFAAPALAAVAAIGVSSIAVWISGNDPVTAFQAMWSQIDSTQSATLIVNRAVPYYIAAISVAIGFKMNLFNIGVNGQYVLAAMLAAAAGAAVDLPPVLHIAMIVVIAVVVGATWAAIPAVLKAYRGVNEVISTIMLNYVATNLIAYLLTEHFRNPEQTNIREARVLPDSARLRALRRSSGSPSIRRCSSSSRSRSPSASAITCCSIAAGSGSISGCRARTRLRREQPASTRAR
ncbi:MAG: hypothetical protein WKF58_01870 [Ilumatobacteraceae bacterium]